jgi:hypothetical protein
VASVKKLTTFKNKHLSQVPKTHVSNLKSKRGHFYLRFFNPIGQGDWFVSSYKLVENDIIFYGLILFNKKRYDYFSLSSLERKKLPFGFKIMMDLDFKPIAKSKLLKSF